MKQTSGKIKLALNCIFNEPTINGNSAARSWLTRYCRFEELFQVSPDGIRVIEADFGRVKSVAIETEICPLEMSFTDNSPYNNEHAPQAAASQTIARLSLY